MYLMLELLYHKRNALLRLFYMVAFFKKRLRLSLERKTLEDIIFPRILQ